LNSASAIQASSTIWAKLSVSMQKTTRTTLRNLSRSTTLTLKILWKFPREMIRQSWKAEQYTNPLSTMWIYLGAHQNVSTSRWQSLQLIRMRGSDYSPWVDPKGRRNLSAEQRTTLSLLLTFSWTYPLRAPASTTWSESSAP